MEVVEMLDNLKERARRDPALREILLATRREKEPLAAFCKKCRELGVPVYEMDLIADGRMDEIGRIIDSAEACRELYKEYGL